MPLDPIEVGAELVRYARENLVADAAPFAPETPLAEAGLDSFCVVELLLFAEQAFGVRVPESALTNDNLASLAALAHCIAALS